MTRKWDWIYGDKEGKILCVLFGTLLILATIGAVDVLGWLWNGGIVKVMCGR